MSTTTPTAIPVFLSGHALHSLRNSGYTLPAALGEVIDNAIEAKANTIDVWFDEVAEGRRKAHISRIAVADDGEGMGADAEGRDILQHYLQLGYSTRYMSNETIGKFGVGAKLGALSFAMRIDVWSRTDGEAPWRHAYFDLDEALEAEREHEHVTIAEPDTEALPEEFEFLLPEGSGTLVLWSKIDRLEHGRWAEDANKLRIEVEKELSRIFRYFLNGGIEIRVQERALLAHDPLMVMERTWVDRTIAEHLRKQAKVTAGAGKEPPQQKKLPTHFEARYFAKRRKISIAGHGAYVTVTLHPEEVTRKRLSGGDSLAKLLRLPENQGRISFVRLNREINYATIPFSFPTAVGESDRFIGIEVAFSPELDEYFGVRNVKRGVEPHGDLRAQLREALATPIAEARAELQRRWDEKARETKETEGEHAEVTETVNRTNKRLPKSRAKGGSADDQVQALTELAEDLGKDEGDEREAYVEEKKEQDVVIESVAYPGQSFIDVLHINQQVIIRINTRHRFYRELYGPIKRIAEQDPGTVSGVEAVETARSTRVALTVLLAAYGKAESMDRSPRETYGDLRNYWGTFLDSMMGDVEDLV